MGMAVEMGLAPLMSRDKVGHSRPTTGGKIPHKEFLKGELKKTLRYWLGTVVLHKICKY